MKKICIDCKNCIIECTGGIFYTAKCKKHSFIKDYVSGETVYEECASINFDGECSFYEPTTTMKIETFFSKLFHK